MRLDKYRGVIPAFYAYCDKAGKVSEDGTRALTRHFVDRGVKGVYMDGSSEEYIYQFVEDRKKMLEAVMGKVADCLTVIAHVACNNTRDDHILTAYAQDLGVGGTAAIPPTYFRLSEYSIAECWNNISEAAPETDFIIYNIPRLTGTALTMNLLETILLNSRVAGVRNSSIPVQDIQMLEAETMKTRQDSIAFDNPDEQLMPGLAIGADGGIGDTYGAMPELSLKIYELVSENRIAEARAIQYEADEIIYKLYSGTCNMYAIIKEVLYISRGVDIGGVRKPLTDSYGSNRAIAGKTVAMIEGARERYC